MQNTSNKSICISYIGAKKILTSIYTLDVIEIVEKQHCKEPWAAINYKLSITLFIVLSFYMPLKFILIHARMFAILSKYF
jgi:hypothetical protein